MSKPELSPAQRLAQHRNDLEKRHLLSLKDKEKAGFSSYSRPGNTNNYRNNFGRFGAQDKGAANEAEWSLEEKPENGNIKSIDMDSRRGLITNGKEDILFYLEQCKYGMRKMKVGDMVTFRRDNYKPRPVAIDVTPSMALVNNELSAEDITFYLKEAELAGNSSVYRMRTILLNREEWPVFLASIPKERMPDVVMATIRMCTVPQQVANPIHTGVIRKFLQLLCWAGDNNNTNNTSTNSATTSNAPSGITTPTAPGTPNLSFRPRREGRPMFPFHLSEMVQTPSLTLTEAEVRNRIEMWVDIAETVLLFRQLVPEVDANLVALPLIAAAQFAKENFVSLFNLEKTMVRKLDQIIRRASPPPPTMLKGPTGSAATSSHAQFRTAIIPSAEEMSVPTWNSASPLCSQNLHVITDDTFAATDEYITAHCQLLRADSFSKTINIIGHLCYDIPAFKGEGEGVTSDHKQRAQEVSQDALHSSLFSKVKFLGRMLSRANDLKTSRSYIFGLEEAVRVVPEGGKAPKPINWLSCLREGTLVCITTSLDRTRMEENEIFWGVVSSNDDGAKAHQMIAIHPVRGDFELLLRNLERNKNEDQEDKSMLLETAVFFTGYRSVMEGLQTYIGPHAAPVPFKEILLAAKKDDIRVDTSGPIEEIERDDTDTASSKKKGDVIASPNRIKDKKTWHIPPFAVPAFRQLVHNSRATYTFDQGQDQSMRKLDRRPIMLVQGPPGTGKSFMGCRIVETYVRYKQMVTSGEILNVVDVDRMADPLLSTIAPSLEANKPNYLGPIVVITYKNHALDEFLMDMRRSKLWDHERARPNTNGISYPRGCRIVRVGTRSTAPELDDFNLNTLMTGSNVLKYSVAPYRERTFILAGRMERLAKEIAYLEKGTVPSDYFRAWLTEEQRKTLAPQQREAWLRGENISAATHGAQLSGGLVPPNHFISYLKSEIREKFDKPAKLTSEATGALFGKEADENPTSTFGAMEREIREAEMATSDRVVNGSCEYFVSERFSASCISAESVRYVTHPPQVPAGMTDPTKIMSLWSLNPIHRHQYYAYLIQRCIADKVRQYLTLQEQIETAVVLRQHAQDEARLQLLQQADVIGLTTTGCAMNQSLLRALKPRLLVVEEAAEVLEAQLVACMSESLSQLVLIGDHYQLKPSVECYELERRNKFNTSLFERLANLIEPILLVEQRRMRPGIAGLVRQFYEKGLKDHASVLSRPFIDARGEKHFEGALGLQKDAFLWSHTHPEEDASSGLSKVNILEIKLCHILVTHLTQQGVAPSSITVITPYLGQRKALAATFANSESSAVRRVAVSTVDLFQGDENDVIIVSLVRTARLTAFMKFRNRMIVACSRARHAMVLIGSEELLSQSEHWNEVLMNLKGNNCVGELLPITQNGEKRLLCQDGTTIKLAE